MCNLLHPSDHYTQLLCTADAVYVNQWRPGQEIIKESVDIDIILSEPKTKTFMY